MKLTRKKLRKIILEAIYFPSQMKQKDIDNMNAIRKKLSPEQIKKADALVKHKPSNMMGYYLGGAPENFPDMPEKIINPDESLDIYKSPYINAGGWKEITMEIDEDVYDLLINKGRLSTNIELEDDYYSLPMIEVYQYFRKLNVDAATIDQVIEYSYYGYERVSVNMGGKYVEFLKVIEEI